MTLFCKRSVARMHGYVPGEQPADGLFIKLNTNENPYPPSVRVGESLSAFDAAGLRRYPNPVSSQLVGKIAAIHACSAEQVVVGNGSDEILALCTRAFVEDDQSIGYLDPSYSLYPVLADIRDVPGIGVPLGEEFQWPGILESAGERQELEGCGLFFVTNPNAPTGILFGRSDVEAFCRAFHGVVAIDEAYVDFAGNDCLDLVLACDNVLVVRTLSKSYSLAGLRVGYAVGHRDLVAALMKIKDSYNLDALSQVAALAALSDREHMRRNVTRILETRERVTASLSGMGYKVYPSDANFLWVRPRRTSAREFFQELRDRRILIRYFEGERTGDCVRVTVGTDAEMDAFLEAAAELAGA